jgi:hypothetical protein
MPVKIILTILFCLIVRTVSAQMYLESDDYTGDSTIYSFKVHINGTDYTENVTQIIDANTIKIHFDVTSILRKGSNFMYAQAVWDVAGDGSDIRYSNKIRLYHAHEYSQPMMMLE